MFQPVHVGTRLLEGVNHKLSKLTHLEYETGGTTHFLYSKTVIFGVLLYGLRYLYWLFGKNSRVKLEVYWGHCKLWGKWADRSCYETLSAVCMFTNVNLTSMKSAILCLKWKVNRKTALSCFSEVWENVYLRVLKQFLIKENSW